MLKIFSHNVNNIKNNRFLCNNPSKTIRSNQNSNNLLNSPSNDTFEHFEDNNYSDNFSKSLLEDGYSKDKIDTYKKVLAFFDESDIFISHRIASALSDYRFEQIEPFLIAIKAKNLKKCHIDKQIEKIAEIIKNPLCSDFDWGDFLNYVKNINWDEIEKIAPNTAKFTPEDTIDFVFNHYLKKTVEFNNKDLTFPHDLGEYLSKNYTSAKDLSTLLAIYPSTVRYVGEIPPDWRDNKELGTTKTMMIYSVMNKFSTEENYTYNDFNSDLGTLLNKEVKIKHLGSGEIGICYKISVEGASDTVLKVFYLNDVHLNFLHGRHIEPQTGLFVNNNTKSGFAKMYFGKVSPRNQKDGFIVSEFVQDDTVSTYDFCCDLNSFIKSNDEYIIKTTDGKKSNLVNGKIVDFGGIAVKKKDNEDGLKSKK